jgi:hypothetical protein
VHFQTSSFGQDKVTQSFGRHSFNTVTLKRHSLISSSVVATQITSLVPTVKKLPETGEHRSSAGRAEHWLVANAS